MSHSPLNAVRATPTSLRNENALSEKTIPSARQSIPASNGAISGTVVIWLPADPFVSSNKLASFASSAHLRAYASKSVANCRAEKLASSDLFLRSRPCANALFNNAVKTDARTDEVRTNPPIEVHSNAAPYVVQISHEVPTACQRDQGDTDGGEKVANDRKLPRRSSEIAPPNRPALMDAHVPVAYLAISKGTSAGSAARGCEARSATRGRTAPRLMVRLTPLTDWLHSVPLQRYGVNDANPAAVGRERRSCWPGSVLGAG